MSGLSTLSTEPTGEKSAMTDVPAQLSLADRLRARTQQLGLTPAQVAEMAGLNRSFVYDILRGRSENPNLERLAAAGLRAEGGTELAAPRPGRGRGRDRPVIENPDLAFVAVPYVNVRRLDGRRAER